MTYIGKSPYDEVYSVVVKAGKNIRSTPNASLNNIRRKTLENEQLPVLGITQSKEGPWLRVPDGWLLSKAAVKIALPSNGDFSSFGSLGALTWEEILKKAATAASPLTEGLIHADIPSNIKVNVTGSPSLKVNTNIGEFFSKNWPWVAMGSVVAVAIIGSVVAVTRRSK